MCYRRDCHPGLLIRHNRRRETATPPPLKNVTLSIDTEDLHRARKIVDIGGVTAEIMVPPFSSPKELMVRHEPASHRIVLEFRYIDSEPPAPLPFVHEGIQITQVMYSRNEPRHRNEPP